MTFATQLSTFPALMFDLINIHSHLGSFYKGSEKGAKALSPYYMLKASSSHCIYPSNQPINDIIHSLHKLFAQISNQVKQTLSDNKLPLVIGGDHSVAIGTWTGVKEHYPRLGLLWIDAHLDAHDLDSTPSGKHHGMPLKSLLEGKGWAYNQKFLLDQPFDPRDVCIIGARSFEEQEHQYLIKKGVKIFYAKDVQELGFDHVLREALSIVNKAQDGFGISFDFDVYDPKFAPGVSTAEKNGVSPKELLGVIKKQLAGYSSQIRALEFVEYNPVTDTNQITLSLAKETIDCFLNVLAQ